MSHNTVDILNDCINNLIKINIRYDYEVIVVDNSSSDGSPEFVVKNHPNVVVIKNSQNELFAKACNKGADNANGGFFLFLNSDAFPEAGSIEILVHHLINNEKIACVGPRVNNTNGLLQSEGHPFPFINLTLANAFAVLTWPVSNNIKKIFLPKGYHRFRYGKERAVDWISGCCMLISRSTWDKIGGFDPDLYFYNEDIEWCYRANKYGYIAMVNPSSIVNHVGGASSGKTRKIEPTLSLLHGKRMFFTKTKGLLYHFLNNILITVLYVFAFTLCKFTKKTFYVESSRRNILDAINNIKIILLPLYIGSITDEYDP